DPRDANHMYLSISVGGCFESHDKGATWEPFNKGVDAEFLPDKDAPFGHDPHCVIYHPANPDRLYQQNHCGIYAIDRPSDRWTRVGRNMPEAIGDIGFPIVVDPEEVDTAWVFPMDGTEVWPRTSPDGKPAVYITRNGGKSWDRQDKGLPREQAYFTVKRQSMTVDHFRPVGIYFGTTGGEIWASSDAGSDWACIVKYLPEIYSLSAVDGGSSK
ncbi:MAG: glycosyl hydrolase, partial [Cyanobacteria bacterium]|nr:glycosyl hydrolase [Cyanobacteriota bacterium]